MTRYPNITKELQAKPRRWLVTGAAGFIGSNLTETLLRLNQTVVALDNFSTGHPRNLDDALRSSSAEPEQLRIVTGDVADPKACLSALEGIDIVLHQAALGSVPRSLDDPLATYRANVDGTAVLMEAARGQNVTRFVFASSSSVYGDDPDLPKLEERVGRTLSPYAASKRMAEVWALTVSQCYDIEAVGLRYFNVFGRRQDPHGPYAAVIPRWVGLLAQGTQGTIFGDGQTSRDFCYVENVVQANLLAATCPASATGEIYNIAYGERTTLNELYGLIWEGLSERSSDLPNPKPEYSDFRKGDVRHSLADIEKARARLGYRPTHSVKDGLSETVGWYLENLPK